LTPIPRLPDFVVSVVTLLTGAFFVPNAIGFFRSVPVEGAVSGVVADALASALVLVSTPAFLVKAVKIGVVPLETVLEDDGSERAL
jgi:hypothetical protein